MKNVINSIRAAVVAVVAMGILAVNAVGYDNAYPAYASVSASAYIECQTTLGKGVLILPLNYIEDSIGFTGTANKPCNLLSSTITGMFVKENGTQYTVRATRFNYFEYAVTEGYGTEYYDLGVSQIYNTNVSLEDYTENGRGKVFSYIGVDTVLLSINCLLLFYISVKRMR